MGCYPQGFFPVVPMQSTQVFFKYWFLYSCHCFLCPPHALVFSSELCHILPSRNRTFSVSFCFTCHLSLWTWVRAVSSNHPRTWVLPAVGFPPPNNLSETEFKSNELSSQDTVRMKPGSLPRRWYEWALAQFPIDSLVSSETFWVKASIVHISVNILLFEIPTP